MSTTDEDAEMAYTRDKRKRLVIAGKPYGKGTADLDSFVFTPSAFFVPYFVVVKTILYARISLGHDLGCLLTGLCHRAMSSISVRFEVGRFVMENSFENRLEKTCNGRKIRKYFGAGKY